jgi:S-(hydroxymethyl)glutathione dehydrogenase/alcohol dehydrogenase
MILGRAAVLEQICSPLVIREIEIPQLLPGQVLVKVHFSGVCRSQLMEVKGGRGVDAWLPHLLGHEGSGEVIAVGVGVKKVRPGDKVILGWIIGNGMEAPGAKYRSDDRIINSGKVTTFSTYTVVSENRVTVKPENLPMDVSVLFGCALLTGAGMVLNEIKPDEGANIVILGLGGVGLSALMALSGFNCGRIIAIDSAKEKLSLAERLGATDVIYADKSQSVYEQVIDMINGGVDICIESAGTVETIELGFQVIKKRGGRLYFASHPDENHYIKIKPFDLISGKNIYGTWGGKSLPDRDIPILSEFFLQKRLPLDLLIRNRYSLDKINLALDDLDNQKVFRPLIVMHQ